MFKVGEKIVYGQTGVCLVRDICEKVLIKNEKRLYYVLEPIYQQNNTIYAPVEGQKVAIRPVITKQEADLLIEKIPEITKAESLAEITAETYREELSSQSCNELIKLTAHIYEKKKIARSQKKKLGFSDEKYMHQAESLLFGELAVALDIPVGEVQKYIESKIKG